MVRGYQWTTSIYKLGQSAAHNPSVLILDEPTSSMDQATEMAVISA